jgi:hypothetical protein
MRIAPAYADCGYDQFELVLDDVPQALINDFGPDVGDFTVEEASNYLEAPRTRPQALATEQLPCAGLVHHSNVPDRDRWFRSRPCDALA